VALNQLSDEQIKTWTLEQKDRWWLANVWKGDMPQLTLRSASTGMLLGGILSLTNLYVGAKTGWTLGVGITSVVLAFALFRVLSKMQLSREFTLLENNCMQSIATSAGYMTAPLVSSMAAYMMVTHQVIPMTISILWIIALALLGVLFAFPLKRRMINDEQLPFPEGRAAGVVLDALHHGDGQQALIKARALVYTGLGSALVKLLQSGAILQKYKLGFLLIPEYLDDFLYTYIHPTLLGIPFEQLTLRADTDFVMMAAGGLMGIRTGVGLLIGAVINYAFLAPWMIHRGDIAGKMVQGHMVYGFKSITFWSLWAGVAMMTTASLYAFLSKPKVFLSAFKNLAAGSKETKTDVLKDIELPMGVFIAGIPIIGGIVVYLAHWAFGISIGLGILAIPLVFVFTLIAANATALTSVTPTGALGKLTQLSYGALAPGNITTNLMTAGITGEVAGNASNLLMDIKPGYMLGAKPRHQAIGHVLGIFAGAFVAVPVFYLIFLRQGPDMMVSEQYPMPGATIWKAVAEILTKGLSNLQTSAAVAAGVGAFVGLLFEVLRTLTQGRFWLSGISIGLAFVLPFNTSLTMFLGSFIFWLATRQKPGVHSPVKKFMEENQEPLCAGVIAGGALMGIAVVIIETFFLTH
jgi:uncharacterized oligopeptide transporter (OPT) family protein